MMKSAINQDNRQKALNAALSQIEKQFGKGAVMVMGQEPIKAIDAISTGSFTLDIALGVGGLPKGRVVEVRARIVWQDNTDLEHDCPISAQRWYLCVHRRRART